MKTKSKIRGHIIRSAAYAALLSCLIVGFSSGFNLPARWSTLSSSVLPGSMTKPATHTRTLTFADRVAYQRAIEEIYWRHRDWPATDGGAKPSLDKVMVAGADRKEGGRLSAQLASARELLAKTDRSRATTG